MSTATLPLSAAARAPLLVPALLACYLVWGSTYLAIRFALVSFPPFFQMGTRFLAAGVLLMAWVRRRHGPHGQRRTAHRLRPHRRLHCRGAHARLRLGPAVRPAAEPAGTGRHG